LAAINTFPERQREVIAYRILLELSAKETAGLLSISVATVGTHLHRALETLRTNYENMRDSQNG
jgi:RNA polymerase sigma factor (sigma-70 family)